MGTLEVKPTRQGGRMATRSGQETKRDRAQLLLNVNRKSQAAFHLS